MQAKVQNIQAIVDKLLRPEVHVLHRSWPSFQVCGYTGLACAIFLSMSLVIHQGLSPWVVAGIILVAVLTFLAQAMLTKIVTGSEDLVYYRHEVAVLCMAALFLWIVHQPVLPYIDATQLGIGIFLACGRVGCLMVGCCHGCPHRWGVCYRDEHARAGFAPYLVGVRLFPSQALESLWVLCIVVVGSLLVLTGHKPGTALAWYVVTYDIGRFYSEFMRGDVERPYALGFSEAQWVSVLLLCIVVCAEVAGLLPFQWWHALAAFAVICTMVVVSLRRRFQHISMYRLLHPYHVKEIAGALERVSREIAAGIQVERTSLGIQLSYSYIKSETGEFYHYTLSHSSEDIVEDAARMIAKLIMQLRHHARQNRLVRSRPGIFHLLIEVPQEDTGSRDSASPHMEQQLSKASV
jgi:hypothetical protein